MRIISGIHRGRTIRPPKNLPVRPTTDKAKEGLFNILNNRVDFDELDVLLGTGGGMTDRLLACCPPPSSSSSSSNDPKDVLRVSVDDASFVLLTLSVGGTFTN